MYQQNYSESQFVWVIIGDSATFAPSVRKVNSLPGAAGIDCL